jgi:hypothetical protein
MACIEKNCMYRALTLASRLYLGRLCVAEAGENRLFEDVRLVVYSVPIGQM